MAPKITSVVGWTGTRSSPSTSGLSSLDGASLLLDGRHLQAPDLLRLLHGVAAELVPQRSQDLCAVRLVLSRREACHQRQRDHRRGHVLVDRVEHGPPALARVLHVAAQPREVVALLRERALGQLAAATTARPSPGSTGGRSTAGRARSRTRASARSPRRRPASARTRPRCGPSSRSGLRRWRPCAPSPSGGASASSIGRRPRDRVVAAADHHAVADLQAPDAAARADVDELDPVLAPPRGARLASRSTSSCRRRRSGRPCSSSSSSASNVCSCRRPRRNHHPHVPRRLRASPPRPPATPPPRRRGPRPPAPPHLPGPRPPPRAPESRRMRCTMLPPICAEADEADLHQPAFAFAQQGLWRARRRSPA